MVEPPPNLDARLRTRTGLVLLLLALAALVSLPFTLMFAFSSPLLLDAPRSQGDPSLAVALLVILATPALAITLIAISVKTLLRYSAKGFGLSLTLAALWLASLPLLNWVVT